MLITKDYMSGGLEVNKIAGAVLLAGVIAMVSGLMAEALYTGSISEHAEEGKRGFSIAVTDPQDTASAEAGKAAAVPVDIMPLMATADIKAGEALIKKCTSCHTFEKGGKNGVGPNQYGLVGGHYAHQEGYSYSAALSALKDKRWGFQELSDFLANPKKAIPGNKMSFAGISNPQDRANLIAYINTLSDKPLPLPK
jgi:cytochrome c